MDAKEAAARRAVEFVRDGMTVGLGTGSTTAPAVVAIGERIRAEGLRLRAVASSERTRELAAQCGIPIVDLSDAGELDLTIDGADEVDPDFNLIKGGGGALVRERLVASAAREFIVIVDDGKLKPVLGAFPLPIAILPYGWKTTQRRIAGLFPDLAAEAFALREAAEGEPYVTDDGLYILTAKLVSIPDPGGVERELRRLPGVVDTGLFVGMASRVIVGHADGRAEEAQRRRA